MFVCPIRQNTVRLSKWKVYVHYVTVTVTEMPHKTWQKTVIF